MVPKLYWSKGKKNVNSNLLMAFVVRVNILKNSSLFGKRKTLVGSLLEALYYTYSIDLKWNEKNEVTAYMHLIMNFPYFNFVYSENRVFFMQMQYFNSGDYIFIREFSREYRLFFYALISNGVSSFIWAIKRARPFDMCLSTNKS